MSIAYSNIDACIHGRIPGNCIRCLQIKIHKQDAEIAALRAENERLKAEKYESLLEYNALRSRAEQAEKELAELQGKRNTAYSYIEDVLIGSPYEWTGKRLLEMIGDKK